MVKYRLIIVIISLITSMSLNACSSGVAVAVQPADPAATIIAPDATSVSTTVVLELSLKATVEPAVSQISEALDVDLDIASSAFLANMQGYNTIKLEAFNEARMSDPPPFILDVREAREAEQSGHIEGAVLIPLRELAQHVDQLPSFDTPILSYCGSGWRCTIAMTALGILGWQDVKCLKDNSFNGWIEAGYPVIPGVPETGMVLNAAQPDSDLLAAVDKMLQAVPLDYGGKTAADLKPALLENPDLILIDVRTDDELAENGVIEAANLIHIPLEKLVEKKADLPAEKNANIVVYCGSGHRSTIAMTILWLYGYTEVVSLKSGFAAWVEAGFPVATFVTP